MLELLPNVYKKAIKEEYLLRVAAVSMSFSLAAGIMLLVSLSPSYFLSAMKGKIANQEFENVKKFENDVGDKELRAEIKSSKEMIALLKSGSGSPSIKDLILKIAGKKNSGVRIDGISMNNSKDGQYQIFIKGTSDNRESLKSFADMLAVEKEFGGVDLPISNFAKTVDIDFNITLQTAI